MTQKPTPLLVSGLLVLFFLSGYYVAQVLRRKQLAAACLPDPTASLTAGEQCLKDHFLAYQSIPGIDWTVRAPKQERPGMPVVK